MKSGTFVYLLTPLGRVRCERRPADYDPARLEDNGERVLAVHNLTAPYMELPLSTLEEMFPPPVRIEGHAF